MMTYRQPCDCEPCPNEDAEYNFVDIHVLSIKTNKPCPTCNGSGRVKVVADNCHITDARVEAVAEAIWIARGFDTSHPEGFQGRPEGIRFGYLRDARAALEAARKVEG